MVKFSDTDKYLGVIIQVCTLNYGSLAGILGWNLPKCAERATLRISWSSIWLLWSLLQMLGVCWQLQSFICSISVWSRKRPKRRMAYIDTSSVPTGMISPVLASPTSTQPPTPLMQNEAAGTTLLVTSQPIVSSPVSSQISPQPSSTQSSKTQPSPQQSIQMSPGKISK